MERKIKLVYEVQNELGEKKEVSKTFSEINPDTTDENLKTLSNETGGLIEGGITKSFKIESTQLV